MPLAGIGIGVGAEHYARILAERPAIDWLEVRPEDASESRGATIAPQYRREIEAYFRAVAKQAAEAKGSQEQD